MNILEDEKRLSLLEEIDNYLGCYGWHLKINDDIETFSFKDDIIVEYYHGLDYPWCIYHLDEFYSTIIKKFKFCMILILLGREE